MERRRFRSGAGASFALVLALACGGGGAGAKPRFTLRQVMFEIDRADKEIQASVGDPGKLPRALESARTIDLWMRDASFGAYLGGPTFRGDPAAFETQRSAFRAILDELIQSGERGDAVGFARTYPRMRMTCEVCHLAYRPELK